MTEGKKALPDEDMASLNEVARSIFERDKKSAIKDHFILVPRSKIIERLGSFCAHHCHGREEACEPEQCPVVQVVEMINAVEEEL